MLVFREILRTYQRIIPHQVTGIDWYRLRAFDVSIINPSVPGVH